jgi:glycerophosphoryl diester phosphodiesterase
MKTLFEVLTHFPNKKFLIDNKSGENLRVAQLIVDVLRNFPKERHENLYIWSADKSYAYIKKSIPNIRRLTLPKEEQKSFYKSYILSFGLMNLPKKYKGEGIGLIPKYTKFIWGWSYRFLDKVYANDTRFYMYLNTKEEFDRMVDIPIDGIITDHIEVLGI